MPASFSVLQRAPQANTWVAFSVGDEPPGGPPWRRRSLRPACVSPLDSTRPVSRAVRQGPSPRPPSPREEWTRLSPATPQVLPGQGRTREAAAEDNHGARTCNFSCSVTEDFFGKEAESPFEGGRSRKPNPWYPAPWALEATWGPPLLLTAVRGYHGACGLLRQLSASC